MEKRYRIIFFALIFMLGTFAESFCCSTPVFRYALEMWPAYSYVIEIEGTANLNESQQQALTLLRNAAVSSELPLNINIIEKESAKNQDDVLMKISFPREHKIPGVLWQGPLTEENINKVINSPSRRKVLEHLQRGDAAVWLFLESGDAFRDDQQYAVLHEELKTLSETLKLSETATDVEGNPLDIKVINTGVNFSSVRIDRNDPMEEIFIRILMRTEPDLEYFEKAPLAFPLFGQGRILYALVGNGIKSKNIETACSTIIGWCSCTIKDDNPGTDMLFAANWNEIIGDSSWIQPEQLPDITGLAGFLDEDDISDGHNAFMEEISVASKVLSTSLYEENIADEIPETPISSDPAPELILEPLRVNNEIIKVTNIDEEQEKSNNPLLRNLLIMFSVITAIIALSLIYLKRR